MIDKIEMLFNGMDLVDKTQFPFPYSQIMKFLLYIWIFTQPFVLAEDCGPATPAVMVLIGVGFFGLDEVAEILESPFGNDPNDIDLVTWGDDLINDVESMFEKANAPIHPVLHDTKDNKHFFKQLNLNLETEHYQAYSGGRTHAYRSSRTHLVVGGGWDFVRSKRDLIAAKAMSRPEVVVDTLQKNAAGSDRATSGTPPPRRPTEATPPTAQP